MTRKTVRSRGTLQLATAHGFSLLELLVAMAVFLIVSGASFTLFQRHQALLSREQGLAGLNIGLRNALTQIQIDVVNAGNGLIVGAYVPSWPMGASIVNPAPSTPCNNASTYSYTASCFDTLNAITVDPDPTVPVLHPQSLSGGCVTTSASGPTTITLYSLPPSGFTPSSAAAKFHAGDQMLFVAASGNPYVPFTTARLSANGATGGSTNQYVALTFNSTLAGGYNNAGATGNDPLNMTTSQGTNGIDPSKLHDSFCSSDWVLRLSPIIYSVDTTTDPTNPKLMRTRGGVQNVVMEQVVSFRVGAGIFGDLSDNYRYNASTAPANGGYYNDFTEVRAIRVSLIGRTKPDTINTYRNLFDQGPYQVLGSSTVVNPRNLSMNNN